MKKARNLVLFISSSPSPVAPAGTSAVVSMEVRAWWAEASHTHTAWEIPVNKKRLRVMAGLCVPNHHSLEGRKASGRGQQQA